MRNQFIWICSFVLYLYVSADEECRKLGLQGECILLSECPSLNALLSLKIPVSPRDRKTLLKAQCDKGHKSVRVCCKDKIPVENNCVKMKSCRTPYNSQGFCIRLTECNSLNQLHIKHRKTIEETQFLLSHQCGNCNKTAFVCCPSTSERGRKLVESSLVPTSRLLPSYNECGKQADGPRIIGGIQTKLRDFPWMAMLIYHNGEVDVTSCAGVLISKRYVLTAAHCTKPADGRKLIMVRLGEHNISQPIDCLPNQGCNNEPQDIPIEEIINHLEYNLDNVNHYNDIALIRLEKDAEYNDFVQPICLPNMKQEIVNNENPSDLWIAGWGHTINGVPSDVKLKLLVPRQSELTCKNAYTNRQIDTNLQFCAGGKENKDSCRSDSGAPIMCEYIDHSRRNEDTIKWFATGIVSFGPLRCGTQGKPGVYTRLNVFIDWILNNLKD